MNQTVQPIEGITPEALWNFILVALALCAVIVLVYKVVEIFRKEQERKKRQNDLQGNDLTDVIAEKVMEKLTPKLEKIEGKLNADKERLDSHELRLNEQERTYQRVAKDTEQIMDVLDGMLMHFISGNDKEKLKEVKTNLDHYKNGRWKNERAEG